MSGNNKQAFPGSRKTAFMIDPKDIVVIGLDTDDGPGHVLYDERINLPIDEAMVLNIMTYGVLETVNVRKNGTDPEVIDGRQRVRCARVANERLEAAGEVTIKVPVMVCKGPEHRLYGVMISSNENRTDDSPLAKATKCGRFMDMGRTEAEAAIAFGVTERTIRTWRSLLDLDPKVQAKIDDGAISASAASKLASLSREEQVTQLDEMLSSGDTTKSTAMDKAKGSRGKKKGTPHSGIGKPVLRKVLAKATDTEAYKGAPLSADAVAVLRWVLGEIEASEIPGLPEMIKAVTAEDKAVAAEKAERKANREAKKAEAAKGDATGATETMSDLAANDITPTPVSNDGAGAAV